METYAVTMSALDLECISSVIREKSQKELGRERQ